ncbi:MAG: PCMD domain-containing protein [Bacteroidales bacterium]
MTRKFFFFFLALSLFISCQKLDELNGNATIDAFVIAEHSPIITIASPFITNDTVYIPILDGMDNFPMRFKANVILSAGTKQIRGIDFNQEQELVSATSLLKFVVMAENGMARTYYICPKKIDGDNYLRNSIEVLSSSPQSLLSSVGVSTVNDTFKIYGALLEYPISLQLNLQIASDASFGNYWYEGGDTSIYNNGKTILTFEQEKVIHLKVVANNGAIREWNLQLINTTMIKGSDPLEAYMLENTAIDMRNTSAESKIQGIRIYDTETNNLTDTIILRLDKETVQKLKFASEKRVSMRKIEFPTFFEAKLNLGCSAYAEAIGLLTNSCIAFSPWDKPQSFYLMDKINLVTRKWTVVLKEIKYDLANVLAFHYDYTAATVKLNSNGSETGPSIILDSSQTKIYPRQKLIQLVASKVNKEFNTPYSTNNTSWKIHLENIRIKLSDGASCKLPIFEWKSTYVKGNKLGSWITTYTQPDTAINQTRDFSVIAENGKVERWTIAFRLPESTKSSACNIERMHIKNLVPYFAKVDPVTPTLIDQEQLNITINLTDDRNAYPLSIYTGYDISAYSTISLSDGIPLVFENANSTRTILITAEDGTNKEYTISLLSPIKAEGADINAISWGTMSSEFSFYKNPIYDSENGVIELPITSADAAFPLSVNYNNISLSEGASITIPSRGSFIFNNSSDARTITVTSEAGNTKTWIVRLLYAPQLKNGTLNSWSMNHGWANNHNPNPTTYWATANTNVGGIVKITGVTATQGISGTANDYSAQLETTSAAIVGLAAGTVFTGWYDLDNAVEYGTKDPVILTFQGLPFTPTAKIVGLTFDAWYKPGTPEKDWGSVVFTLINWDGSKGPYRYHGDTPGATITDPMVPHMKNTAVAASQASLMISSSESRPINGKKTINIGEGQWKKDIFLPLNGNVKFTHLSIIFSSSAFGDSFIGEIGSMLKIDNIRIVYE